MFRPCVVIPVYNHPHRIADLVAQIQALGLPVFLIDDGSETQCASLLQRVAKETAGVTLITLPRNCGKGTAVVTGLRLAYTEGFSHALQIDADGQHAPADIPRFIAVAQRYPEAVVSGDRIYSHAPRSRRFARKLTDFWVCVNTLSREIRDSMCGFRLYPLAATTCLLAHTEVGARMDFDSDIIVRLFWQGCRVLHVSTPVIYAAEIPSHFDVVNDNMRITWMHTRLFFGMLRRLPVLLWQAITRPPLPSIR